MKKGFSFSLFLALGISFLMCGCATVKELAPEKRKGEPVVPDYKLAREVLVHFMNNNAEGFTRKLTPENKRDFDVKKFEETRSHMLKSLGTPVSFSYLTELEFVTFKLYVWKVKFRRVGKDSKTREEKVFFSEALFRVITGRSGGKVLIMGFSFL